MVDVKMEIKYIIMGLRIGEILFGVFVLSLTSQVANYFDKNFNVSINQVSFLLFCGLWGFLLGIALLLIPRLAPQPDAQPVVLGTFIADILTALLYFAGFIALAAIFGNNGSTTVVCEHLSIVDSKTKTTCQCTQAAITFGAFAWILWTISAIFSAKPVLDIVQGKSTSSSSPAANNNNSNNNNAHVESAPAEPSHPERCVTLLVGFESEQVVFLSAF